MAKFEITVPIEGTATYEIEAPNKVEALALVKDGEGVETTEWDWTMQALNDEGFIDVKKVD